MEKKIKNPEEKNATKIFQMPSLEDRAKISGNIEWEVDEDSISPQCPGSQCYTLCCRC